MSKIGFLSEMFYYYDGIQHQEGGGENYELSLIQTLIKAGHDISIYQFSFKPFTNKYKHPNGSITVRGLGNITSNNYEADLQKGVDMFLAKTEDCDMHILLTVNLAYKKMPRSTVSIFHGIYWNFQSETYKQPEWNENYVKRWIRNVNTIVSVDTDCINFVRANYPKYIDKMFYVPNYVDIDIFKPMDRVDKDVFKILYARRLNELRGLLLFLQVAKDLTEEYEDIYFTICGKGLEDSEKSVANWCKTQRHCSHTSHILSEMYLEYPKHDVNVIPSIASEGLSLSMLEGMACGLATIATDVGGLPNALITGLNGLMIRANSTKELSDTIEWCYLHREQTANFGKNAIAVATTFNKRRWENQWLSITNSILEK